MRRILTLILMVSLLLTDAAWAAPGDLTLFTSFNESASQTRSIISMTVVDETIYTVCSDYMSDAQYMMIALKAGETDLDEYTFVDLENSSYLYGCKLFAWSNKLMMMNMRTGVLYEITLAEGQATLTKVMQLPLVEHEGASEEDMIRGIETLPNPWVEENMLYTIMSTFNGEGNTVTAYDLTDGTSRVITDKLRSGWTTPGREGELLYATMDSDDWKAPATLYALSLEDGSSKEITKLMTNAPDALTYDAAHERVIYITDGTIYATALEGNQEELGTLPFTYFDGRSQYIPEGDFLVLSSQENGLIVRNLDPQYRATRTLTIRTSRWDVDETYMAFTASHPDVEVKALTADGRLTADEVTQAMMNGSSDADIYVLTVDSSAFNAMVGRGYVGDLSSSEILAEAISRMYPQFADVLTKDGKVIAFPKEEYSQGYTFNAKLGEEMGIIQPKTWGEFLDLVARWDADFSQEYPEKTIFYPESNAEMKKTLMSRVLQDYEALLNRPDQAQTFDTPALRHLLECLDKIDYAPFNSQEDFNNSYSWNSEDVLTGGGDFLPKQGGFVSMFADEESLLLSLDGETEPVVPVTMTVYVVNPYSKNQDLAIEYLEACAQTMPQYRQLLYFADWTDPIENPEYESNLASYDTIIAEYTEMLNHAANDEQQKYEEMLETMKTERERVERENRYIYTEEQIRAYQDKVQYFVVMRHRYIRGGTETGTDEMAVIVQRYVDGQMDARQMLTELDQKLRMMQMENNS